VLQLFFIPESALPSAWLRWQIGTLMANRDVIPPADLADCLARCPAWELEGREITRTFEFTSFSGAIDFVNAVAEIAEDAGHHPDIDIRYARITLRLTTHSEDALTEVDFEVAQRIDNLAG